MPSRLFTTTLAVACLGLAAAGALAQGFPARPITLIVPWPAGGSTQTIASERVLIERLGLQAKRRAVSPRGRGAARARRRSKG